MRIIDINQSNVETYGFFCYMSKKKSVGYQRKLKWLKQRFTQGMRIKLLELPDRGFIEYLPGEHAWRAVDAKGYMFIHCLWMVGRSKGQGYASALLNACIRDAEKSKMKGVAMVTSEKVWLMGRRLLEKHGFDCVEEAAPAFSLMVKRFKKAKPPSLLDNTATIRRRFAKGLTVLRSDQCPYIQDATTTVVDTAKKVNMHSRVEKVKTAKEAQTLSPSPYGVFGIVLDGRLLSYHYLLEKDLLPLLRKRNAR